METRGPEGREGQPGREGPAGREGLPGLDGVVGPKGEVGEKGKTGAPLPRNVRLAFWFVVLVSSGTLTVLAYAINENREVAAEGENAHTALCLMRSSDVDRANRTAEFLQKHPEEEILGVPRETIERSLREQLQTITALRILNCPEDN